MIKKEKIVEDLKLTKDAALGMPVVTVIGNYEVYVENFKSIVCYECGYVKLMTKQGLITIEGNALEIKYYDQEEIAIKGRICKVEY